MQRFPDGPQHGVRDFFRDGLPDRFLHRVGDLTVAGFGDVPDDRHRLLFPDLLVDGLVTGQLNLLEHDALACLHRGVVRDETSGIVRQLAVHRDVRVRNGTAVTAVRGAGQRQRKSGSKQESP